MTQIFLPLRATSIPKAHRLVHQNQFQFFLEDIRYQRLFIYSRAHRPQKISIGDLVTHGTSMAPCCRTQLSDHGSTLSMRLCDNMHCLGETGWTWFVLMTQRGNARVFLHFIWNCTPTLELHLNPSIKAQIPMLWSPWTSLGCLQVLPRCRHGHIRPGATWTEGASVLIEIESLSES